MQSQTAIVVTSINSPNAVLAGIARQSLNAGWTFILVGYSKSPQNFALEGCCYFDLEAQIDTGLRFAKLCPTRNYARKNVGYLIAIRDGASLLVETDDDNFPRKSFFQQRERHVLAPNIEGAGWINVYRYFSENPIWPRGFPLDCINDTPPSFDELVEQNVDCPIQQGLVDENPDVDAIYRLCFPLPQSFVSGRTVALSRLSWCPFNSQNTAWWPDTFPLLYLPAYCSFRMTDIWRSFVAQRIAWENHWSILFHGPNVWQERNAHNFMKDFADEVPGYLNNARVAAALSGLCLDSGPERIPDNMRACYRALVDMNLIAKHELSLLDAWLEDLSGLS